MSAPVVELAGCLLQLDHRGITHFRRYEVLIPLQQVADGGQEPAVAINVFERHIGMKSVPSIFISDRAPFDDTRKIVAPRGMGHAERLKNPLRSEERRVGKECRTRWSTDESKKTRTKE